MASQWPAPNDFVGAIQNPRVCFSNPELRFLKPALDKFGMPVVTSGQFAYVFKLNNPNGGKAQAIRCFRGLVGDREQRYERINAHLDKVSVPYFASFEYDSVGILVNGMRYPTLVMEWITGVSLELYMASLLTRPDVLQYLGESWLKLLSSLRDSGTAHGDLQHGNIILENNAYRLVDLDGLWVPSMNGWKACELGHRHYQHPGRTEKHFDKDLDNFSGLVIYLSIMAVAERPDLWKRFHDENLIFTKSDFDDPSHSELFRLLKQLSPVPRRLAETLADMCKQDPAKCPSVLDLVESGHNKLPAWMQSGPKVTVQAATREVGVPTVSHPTQVLPPSQSTIQTTSSPWWKQPATAPGALSHPIPPPSPSVAPAFAANVSAPMPNLWTAVFRRAVNLAWASLLGIWLWYPIGRNVLVACGLDTQQAGIWTVFSFVGLCVGIGLYKEKAARNIMRAGFQTTPVGVPLNPQPQPVYIPTQYSPPIYSSPQPVQPSATPPQSNPVSTQSRPTSQAPAPAAPAPRPVTSNSGRATAVVGSRVKSIYHRPSCRWAAKISLRNRRQFSSASDARNAGFKPCGTCNP